LTKGPSGFEGTVLVPWSEKIPYKFIVDGRWTTTDLAPTEVDPAGNMNNVYHAPTKPTNLTKFNESPSVPIVLAAEPQDKASQPLPTPEEKKLVPEAVLIETPAASSLVPAVSASEPQDKGSKLLPSSEEKAVPEPPLSEAPAASLKETVSPSEKPAEVIAGPPPPTVSLNSTLEENATYILTLCKEGR
jgi:Glycogen recognition site of AMP-activated protein kinase